jgi:hypothetical protein
MILETINNKIKRSKKMNNVTQLKVYQSSTSIDPTLATNRMVKTTSENYKFQSSQELIDKITSNGFELETVSYAKPRKKERYGYQKHIMIFKREDLKIDENNYVRLLVTNAHDGRSSLKFNLGIYRTVCANGLVVGDSFFSDRVIHLGNNFDRKVDEILERFVAKLPEVISLVRQMKSVEVDSRLKARIAMECVKFAHNGEKDIVDIESVMRVRRSLDKATNLYTVFNVIQENILRGKYQYRKHVEKTDQYVTRKARAIKSIDRARKVNQHCFEVALKYLSVA